MTTAADAFFGGSAKSAKFETIGETVGGPITHIGSEQQQTEFGSGKPLFWDNGEPRTQLPITVQTNLRDASDATDDGQRTFYVKGEMKKAIGAALRAAGAKMAIGGTITITYTGDEPTKGFPKKLYSATYTPPVPGAGFFEEQPQQAPQPVAQAPVAAPQPVAQAPVAAPQPAAQQAPQAAPGMVQLTAEQYAAMQAGMQAAMAQQAAPPAAAPQQPAYADYAAQMGFPQQ